MDLIVVFRGLDNKPKWSYLNWGQLLNFQESRVEEVSCFLCQVRPCSDHPHHVRPLQHWLVHRPLCSSSLRWCQSHQRHFSPSPEPLSSLLSGSVGEQGNFQGQFEYPRSHNLVATWLNLFSLIFLLVTEISRGMSLSLSLILIRHTEPMQYSQMPFLCRILVAIMVWHGVQKYPNRWSDCWGNDDELSKIEDIENTPTQNSLLCFCPVTLRLLWLLLWVSEYQWWTLMSILLLFKNAFLFHLIKFCLWKELKTRVHTRAPAHVWSVLRAEMEWTSM